MYLHIKDQMVIIFPFMAVFVFVDWQCLMVHEDGSTDADH